MAMNHAPIEVRINKHPLGGYMLDVVYGGIANVVTLFDKFARYSDANNYAKQKYPNIPRIRGAY